MRSLQLEPRDLAVVKKLHSWTQQLIHSKSSHICFLALARQEAVLAALTLPLRVPHDICRPVVAGRHTQHRSTLVQYFPILNVDHVIFFAI
jgi:hypothetical protein